MALMFGPQNNFFTIMKKSLILIAASALLFAGCSKENASIYSGDTVCVTVRTSLPDMGSKAVIDGDGQADSLDHWVVEVRDTLQKDVVYYWEEKSGEKGAKSQTFELTLVKDHTYDIAFWADKNGCYNAANLKQVSFTDITKVGNSDSYDAFFTCKRFKASGSTSMTATLYRPLAQINIITTDLPKLKAGSTDAAFLSYKPNTFSFKATVPTVFDAFSGKTSGEQETTITPAAAADTCYGDYAAAEDTTTIHMIYVLTTLESAGSASDVRNINFSFKSGNVDIPYMFTDIPLKRNYRTNIIGALLTNTTEWMVTVDPGWDSKDDGSDDINVDYPQGN